MKFLNGVKSENISTLLDDDLLEFKPDSLFFNQGTVKAFEKIRSLSDTKFTKDIIKPVFVCYFPGYLSKIIEATPDVQG